ncbi:Protein kinase domain protein [Theileria parva strain Muguga]|uniref:Aurora kinase n=1 Tax=Theileria parva TaxID=5875 RepID=Q4N5V1_THEPA|nr:Protein kinase domain protein [Theileria parva strain Muguga]EAN32472.1 Protein kinase domain protein [Theileria parva strain Muguga]|eukprot:XP_764755.1 protein kinase [Theileria parva strain Muguga]
MLNGYDCSCTRLTASATDIASKSSSHSLWFTLDDFDIGGVLGDGAHGRVFLARERRTGFICVLKCISKAQLVGTGQESMFKREIELHSHLRHPNISCLYTWFTTKTMIFMVIEYCHNGDLFSYLMRKKRIPEKEVCEIMFQVIWALRTCHDKHIAHLDIKPENILLDQNNVVKLADFGLSAHINFSNPSNGLNNSNGDDSSNGINSHGLNTTNGINNTHDPVVGMNEGSEKLNGNLNFLRGTYDYWSPEQCTYKYNSSKRFGEFGPKTDIWTIGVLAFELFFGLSPFGSTTEERLDTVLDRIQTLEWYEFWQKKYKNLYLNEMSREFRDFLDKCFIKQSHLRPDASQLLQHPWIKLYNSHRFTDSTFLNQPRP